MLAVLSGGGTAGHINPALALAEELIGRGCQVCFAGTPEGLEARLVPQAGIDFTPFQASGFNRRHPLTLPRALVTLAKSSRAAKVWFREINPSVVVGFGGYVSIPVAHAAEQMGIPVVIHEQNSVMGLANRKLAKRAAVVCVTYEISAKSVNLAPDRVVITGNPVRRSVLDASREEGRRMLGIADDELMLLIFGGSLGAHHINEAVCALKNKLLACTNVHVVHVTGSQELSFVRDALALNTEEQDRWTLIGYQDRMGETLAAADLIVSRAGASSLAEISVRAIPALLVPFPYATADHQTTNARAYVEAGCATLVSDAELDSPLFAERLFTLLTDADLRASMRIAAQAQETRNAAVKLADVVMAAARH